MRYPGDRFEVIVVDDGSASSLEPVVTPFRKQLNLTLMKQANAGPAAARNTGAKQAKREFLVFTDNDCQPDPDWLSALGKHLAQTPDRIIGGRTINTLDKILTLLPVN
ncbi:MAG: glycosyltransferase family A protein [bacterium]